MLGALTEAVDRPAGGLQNLAGTADQLPGDQERDEHICQPAEFPVPSDQEVLVATVGVPGRIGVVLEQVDVASDALVVQSLLRVDDQAFEDALPRLVMGDQAG